MASVSAPLAAPGLVLDRARRGRWWLFVAVAALFATMLLALMIGPVRMAPLDVLHALAQATGLSGAGQADFKAQVIAAVRLPRVVLCALVGASLGVCGAVMQGLFRNPLADPGLIGVSAGGALGAVLVIVLGPRLGLPALNGFTLPLAAFAGALAVTAAIYRISQYEGKVIIPMMLLAGVAANALAGALIGFLTFLSDEQQLRLLTFWTLGSVGGASWAASLPGMVVMLLTTVLALRLARPLNALLLGEVDAQHLGVAVVSLKRRAALLTALGVGAAVATSGIIGFIGLVTPHLVRLVVGPDHRHVLPLSAVVGAMVLSLADLAARMVVVPAELPLGVVTAMIGAPFFLVLLLRRRASGEFG